MINFLEETKEDIRRFNHKIKDIIFIGSMESGHQCTWDEFTALAKFNYDNGYGTRYIAGDLIIVFDNGDRMYRDTYDGSEWWGRIRAFKQPEKKLPIKRFRDKDNYVDALADINE